MLPGKEISVQCNEVSGPRGVDTLKFIMSSQQVDLTPLTQEGVEAIALGITTKNVEPAVGEALDNMFLKSSGAIARTIKAKKAVPIEGWDV